MVFGKLGRKPAEYRTNTPRLANFVVSEIPPVSSVDYTTKVESPWQMLLNDEIGDCTIAAVGHLVMGFSVTEDDPRLQMMSNEEALTYYKIIGKYDENDPTSDNGVVMTQVLDYWRHPGIRINTIPNTILGYTYLSPKNIPLMRYALRYFGGLYIGVMLPKSTQDHMDYWDDIGDTQFLGGHCITLQGVDDNNDFYGITWGQRVRISSKFLASYCDEMYLVLNHHFKNVDGLKMDELKQALTLVHNQPI